MQSATHLDTCKPLPDHGKISSGTCDMQTFFLAFGAFVGLDGKRSIGLRRVTHACDGQSFTCSPAANVAGQQPLPLQASCCLFAVHAAKRITMRFVIAMALRAKHHLLWPSEQYPTPAALQLTSLTCTGLRELRHHDRVQGYCGTSASEQTCHMATDVAFTTGCDRLRHIVCVWHIHACDMPKLCI
jgi:hypothetical protein